MKNVVKFVLNKLAWRDLIAGEAVGYVAQRAALDYIGVSTGTTLLIDFLKKVFVESAEVRIPVLEDSKFDEFLIHSPFYISLTYRRENPIHRNIPYVEVVSYVERIVIGNGAAIEIEPDDRAFRLTSFTDENVEAIREQAFEAFKEAGKIRHDSNTVRVNDIRDDGEKTVLTIQRAKYSQQAKSNLVLDYDRQGTTMRKALSAEFGSSLPPLHEKRVANTLGLAIIVFYLDEGRLTPFIVPRTKGVAVFNHGEWHCTASGAAEWPDDFHNTSKDFNAFIMDDLYKELADEVGLLKSDLTNVLPLALCREMVRAGKPQLFFIGFTRLGYGQLKARLKKARRKAKRLNEPEEVYDLPLFRFPDDISTAADAAERFEGAGFTSEGAAALFYAWKLLHLGQKMDWYAPTSRA